MLGWSEVILERRKRTGNYKVVGRSSRSSHCQEPLAGASRVFLDLTPIVTGGEFKELKASEKKFETKIKVCAKDRQEQSKKRKAPEEKVEAEVCENGCWFVCCCSCGWRSLRTS